MKLRIRGNSIRLRLTQTEIKTLANGQAVEDAISFTPTERLSYNLVPVKAANSIAARFAKDSITVKIPWELALNWAKSDQVSVFNEPVGFEPKVLIEKDFFCLKPRQHEVEDESDLFPNPNEAHGSCGGRVK